MIAYREVESRVVLKSPLVVCGVAAELLALAERGAVDLDAHPSRAAVDLARSELRDAGGCHGIAVAALQRAAAGRW